MRKLLVNLATGLLILSVLFTGAWSLQSAVRWLRPEPSKSAMLPGEPTQAAIEESPIEVQRFSSVEAYFSSSNPNPLSYRRGEPLFERDVSRAKRSAVLLRDGGCLVCGATEQLECDHRIALMNGGDNSMKNLGTLCDECHKEKTRYDWSIQRRRRKN